MIVDVQKIKVDEIKTIVHYIGFVLICIASFMVIPIATSLIYNDNTIYLYSFINSTFHFIDYWINIIFCLYFQKINGFIT